MPFALFLTIQFAFEFVVVLQNRDAVRLDSHCPVRHLD